MGYTICRTTTFPTTVTRSNVIPYSPLGAYESTATDRMNASIYEWCDYTTTIGLVTTTGLALQDGPRRNGGLIINFQTNSAGRSSFFYAELNQNLGVLRLRRYSGTSWSGTLAQASGLPIVVADWYRIRVAITEPSPGAVQLDVGLKGLTDEDFPDADISVTSSLYGDPSGKIGVGADRAICRFSYFDLKVLP